MITDNELLDIELRNKGNADVAALLAEIRIAKTEQDERSYDAGYDAGYDEAMRGCVEKESDDEE